MIAVIVSVILQLLAMGINNAQAQNVEIIPAFVGPHDYEDGVVDYCLCDECCYSEAVKDYADEFTAIFNAVETKWAKNGALMVKSTNGGGFKFAKRG